MHVLLSSLWYCLPSIFHKLHWVYAARVLHDVSEAFHVWLSSISCRFPYYRHTYYFRMTNHFYGRISKRSEQLAWSLISLWSLKLYMQFWKGIQLNTTVKLHKTLWSDLIISYSIWVITVDYWTKNCLISIDFMIIIYIPDLLLLTFGSYSQWLLLDVRSSICSILIPSHIIHVQLLD